MKATLGGSSPTIGAIGSGTRFNGRRFVALTAALSGLCLPFSGLQVHLHQLDSILSAPRHSWMAIHVALGVLFLAAVVVHATFNRRALMNHLFGGAVARSALSHEAVAAIAIVSFVLLVAATHGLR